MARGAHPFLAASTPSTSTTYSRLATSRSGSTPSPGNNNSQSQNLRVMVGIYAFCIFSWWHHFISSLRSSRPGLQYNWIYLSGLPPLTEAWMSKLFKWYIHPQGFTADHHGVTCSGPPGRRRGSPGEGGPPLPCPSFTLTALNTKLGPETQIKAWPNYQN